MIEKRSVTIRGHRTSISLENEFWDCLGDIANAKGRTVSSLIAELDEHREPGVNLSSATRVYVLNWYRSQATY